MRQITLIGNRRAWIKLLGKCLHNWDAGQGAHACVRMCVCWECVRFGLDSSRQWVGEHWRNCDPFTSPLFVRYYYKQYWCISLPTDITTTPCFRSLPYVKTIKHSNFFFKERLKHVVVCSFQHRLLLKAIHTDLPTDSSLSYSFAIVGINITDLAYSLLVSGALKTHLYNVAPEMPSLPHFQQTFCESTSVGSVCLDSPVTH